MSTARHLQKTIHAACRELGLDADTRHDLQLAACGKASMRDMTEADLRGVLSALRERGYSPKQGRARRPAASRADIRLIHVLWRKLAEAGAVRRPGRDGLNAFIRARFEARWGTVPLDVDQMREWRQIDAVIQALKAMCERHGVRVEQ